MPFENPWRSVFQPGDYIFGYANTITQFCTNHQAEGASDKDKIQELSTDRAQALDGKGKAAEKESFLKSLELHLMCQHFTGHKITQLLASPQRPAGPHIR